MVGIGPRVGGAHVEVNLDFDDETIDSVGRRIHNQLSSLNKSLADIGDRNRRVYREIGKDSVLVWRALLGAVVTSAPLLGSAISAVAGTATMLADALNSALKASLGLAPILASIGIAAATAKFGMKGFFDAIGSGDMEGLTPSARASAKAIRGLSGAWERMRDAVQESLFAGLSDDFAKLGTTLIPTLQRGLVKMADSLNGLAQSGLDYVNSQAGLKKINDLLDNSADIFGRLSAAVVPFMDGLLAVLNALAPAGQRMADRIADIAKRFQTWANAPGFAERIDESMQRAETTAGKLLTVLGNLGAGIGNIFDAVNPGTNTFLDMLIDVTGRFKEWSSSVEGQEAIATWAEQSVDVMKQFGKTMWAIGEVIAELAQPGVIISFLKTVEDAFKILGDLPLDRLVDAFLVLADVFKPIAGPMLAAIIAGAAFNMIIGNMMGQLGGLIGFLGRTKNLFAPLFKPLKVGGKDLSGVSAALSRLGGAFKYLKKFAKFIPFAGLAIWIADVIANSDALKEKFGEVWDALKGVGDSIATAFGEIGVALEPLAPVFEALGSAVGWVFDRLDELMELAIWAFLDGLESAFKSIAEIIEGLGSTIAGIIEIFTALFTLDADKLASGWEKLSGGLSKVFGEIIQIPWNMATTLFTSIGEAISEGLASGITSAGTAVGDAIVGVANSIIDWFKDILGIASPSTVFFAFGEDIVTGLINGILGLVSSAVAAITTLATSLLGGFATLPGQMLQFGQNAVTWFANALSSGTERVRTIVTGIVTGIVTAVTALPGRLFAWGAAAVTSLSTAVSAGIGRLRAIAAGIVAGIITTITTLPGRLFSLGQQAISRFAGAISAGVGRARSVASSIVSAIVSTVSGLPGRMLSIGARIVSSLVSGLRSRLASLREAASGLAGVVRGVFPGSPVEYGPLTAWNRGGGATGGGRNVVDAIAAGLRNVNPIREAMKDVASAVSSSFNPSPGMGSFAGAGGSSTMMSRSLSVTINNPQPETGSDSLSRTTRNLAYLGLA